MEVLEVSISPEPERQKMLEVRLIIEITKCRRCLLGDLSSADRVFLPPILERGVSMCTHYDANMPWRKL